MVGSIGYADTTYGSGMPKYRESYDHLLAFKDLMSNNGNFSLDVEFDKLESDLQVLFKEGL